MNGWGALQEILVLAMVHTGSCKTRTIGKGGQKLKCKGEGQYLKEREQNIHWVQASWSSLCGSLLKSYKLREHTVHMGRATSSHGEPPCTGTWACSVALLD